MTPTLPAGFTLRPYQNECLAAVRDQLASGAHRLLVAMATGTGKTVVFAQLPQTLNRPGRWLVLAHRAELLDQALAKLQAANPGLTCAVEQADRRAGAADVVIASVPTLQGKRLAALDPAEFAGVVVDEAHHAVAASYLRVFEHFGLLEDDCPRPLLGFTATPRRGDDVGLSQVFQTIAYEMAIREGIEQGWLAPLAGMRIATDTDLSGVKLRHGDFVASQLAAAVDTDERNALVVRAYLEHAAGRRALAFCAGVDHAARLAEVFRARDVTAATINGGTPKDERQAILQQFAAGELHVVTNCGVLTEGYDDPGVSCILMARPTKSSLLYQQVIGRGTRTAAGKSDCLVLDFVDNSTRHVVNTVSTLFGLPPNLDLAGRAALEVKAELEQTELEFPWLDLGKLEHVDDLKLVASKIEFFNSTAPAELERWTNFTWAQLADGGYRLTLPDHEALEVAPTRLDTWLVRFFDPNRAGRTLAEKPSLREALRTADASVRRHRKDATRLVDTRARWRQQPATKKQLELLDRLGVDHPEGLTKGQAAAVITMSFEQGRRPRRRRRQHEQRADTPVAR